jgi:hypothetical protein
MPHSRIGTWLAAGLAGGALALATAARAESTLAVDYPDTFGVIPAATYDVERHRVGKAHLVVEELDDGRVRMFSESGFTAGPRTVLTALLEPVGDEHKLRPVLQQSRSFDASGAALGVLTIDHEHGVGRCENGAGELVSELPLPSPDRVANVTLNLLFQPLVRKERDDLHFQLFLCGGGAKLIDFVANLSPASRNGKGPPALEVRYSPDFGFASLVARRFVPKLSVWFDSKPPHAWLAHRVPLYGDGPEVFVIREGVPPRWLGDD